VLKDLPSITDGIWVQFWGGSGFCLEVGVGSWNGEVLEDDSLCLMGRWLTIGAKGGFD
jgi:hypothetical protein